MTTACNQIFAQGHWATERRRHVMARHTANSAGATVASPGAAAAGAAVSTAPDPFAALGQPATTPAPAADPFAALGGDGTPPMSPGLDSLSPNVSRESILSSLGAAGGPSGPDPAMAAALQGLVTKVDSMLAQLVVLQNNHSKTEQHFVTLTGLLQGITTNAGTGFQQVRDMLQALAVGIQGLAAAGPPVAAPQAAGSASVPVAYAPAPNPTTAVGMVADSICSVLVPMLRKQYENPAFPRLQVIPQNAQIESILVQACAGAGLQADGPTIVAALVTGGFVKGNVIAV